MKTVNEAIINPFLTTPHNDVTKGNIGEIEVPLDSIKIMKILPIILNIPAIRGRKIVSNPIF